MSMFGEFKKFAVRGNVVDLAIGVIIGASFTGIVNSLVNDVIMPPIGLALGGVDFSNFFLVLKGDTSVDTLAAAKAAKDVTINYGLFINACISFLIVTFVLFLLLRQLNKLVAPPACGRSAPAHGGGSALARHPGFTQIPVMKPVLALLLLPVLSLAWPQCAFAADDPAAAANAFYAVYKDHHAQGGIPDATERVRYSPVLSPRLNKQLAAADAAQGRLTAKVKNAVPPMLEGDVFSSLFEGATAWKVGACQGDTKTARCPVALSYVPPPSPKCQSAQACSLERHGIAGEHAARLESGRCGL